MNDFFPTSHVQNSHCNSTDCKRLIKPDYDGRIWSLQSIPAMVKPSWNNHSQWRLDLCRHTQTQTHVIMPPSLTLPRGLSHAAVIPWGPCARCPFGAGSRQHPGPAGSGCWHPSQCRTPSQQYGQKALPQTLWKTQWDEEVWGHALWCAFYLTKRWPRAWISHRQFKHTLVWSSKGSPMPAVPEAFVFVLLIVQGSCHNGK